MLNLQPNEPPPRYTRWEPNRARAAAAEICCAQNPLNSYAVVARYCRPPLNPKFDRLTWFTLLPTIPQAELNHKTVKVNELQGTLDVQTAENQALNQVSSLKEHLFSRLLLVGFCSPIIGCHLNCARHIS